MFSLSSIRSESVESKEVVEVSLMYQFISKTYMGEKKSHNLIVLLCFSTNVAAFSELVSKFTFMLPTNL